MHESDLLRRIARQQRFILENRPGTLFYHRGAVAPMGKTVLIPALKEHGIATLCNPRSVQTLVDEYLLGFRGALESFYSSPGDAVPTIQAYVGIGAVTSAMTGHEASFSDDAVWCEPNMSWSAIERLEFSHDNAWVEFALLLNRALMKRWEGDFLICPYIFRSPLDAAGGIRGTELFVEMYDAPERCKRLIDWCTDWNIAMRRYLEEEIEYPDGCHQGVWSTWLPPGSAFVNGDPVDMISREMQSEFDAPFTGRMFSELSGGFYHHHALGLYQADHVAQTDGILVQEILPDPSLPNPVDTILRDPAIAERTRTASQQVPLMLKNVPNALLPDLMRIFRDGRVILWLQDSSPKAIGTARKTVDVARSETSGDDEAERRR